MKKLITIVAIAAFITSCNSGTSTNADTSSDSTMMDKKMTDDSSSSMHTMSPGAAADGSMTMNDGKMMVMKEGNWVLMDQPMTCTDECKVMPSGEVIMKGGEKMMMTEGMTIDKDGHMMDANGKMMMMDDHNMKMDSEKK